MFKWKKKQSDQQQDQKQSGQPDQRQDQKQTNSPDQLQDRLQSQQIKQAEQNNEAIKQPDTIPAEVTQCEKTLRALFHNTSDLILQIFETAKQKTAIAYIDGMVNKDLINRDILTPLKSKDFNGNILFAIKTNYKTTENFSTVTAELLNGNVAVFSEDSKKAVVVDFKGWEQRSVDVPEAESVVRGPKESFNENIRTNTSLIRRKIKNPNLMIENSVIGKQTRTSVSLIYIEGIVNRDVLTQVKERLAKIDTDSILESGYIEKYLTKRPLSPISGVGLTQKPDVVAAQILEGRVAIVCDGTPHVLTIPELFIENLHSAEDYYNRSMHATIIRLLRVVGLFITVLLPGLAVAALTYNQEMVPAELLSNVITATQRTPMPEGAEVLLMIIMFELLREAGTRLPKSVGSAITIVGSLIVGDTAVSAGLVGAPTVIIVALTAVTSFIVPNLQEFTIIYRFIFLFLGGTMGLVGIGAGLVLLLTQLCSTESFGIPILSSFSKQELKDGLIRMPLWTLKFRPVSIAKDNVRRQK